MLRRMGDSCQSSSTRNTARLAASSSLAGLKRPTTRGPRCCRRSLALRRFRFECSDPSFECRESAAYWVRWSRLPLLELGCVRRGIPRQVSPGHVDAAKLVAIFDGLLEIDVAELVVYAGRFAGDAATP